MNYVAIFPRATSEFEQGKKNRWDPIPVNQKRTADLSSSIWKKEDWNNG